MTLRRNVICLVAALSLAASACGSDKKTVTAATTKGATASTAVVIDPAKVAPKGDCSKAEIFCVGVVTDVGKVDDKSFNQSAWTGAATAAQSLGGGAKYIETTDPKDYANNVKQFTDQKYDLIVTVGFALGDATTAAATANPTVNFIGVDQFQVEATPNLAGLVFNEDKAGFMAGALAGLLTKTNKVGAVLGTDKVPPVVAYKTGWENGAKYTNPKVELKSTYHPGGLDKAFSDPEWGATTAKQALDQGVDVLFGAGGKTGNGALAEVAKKSGAICVGVDSDQWGTVPEAHPCLVTSAMKLIDAGVIELATAAKGGKLPKGNFFGKVGLAPYHDLSGKVPADVAKKVDEVVKGISDGSIPTGYKP